MMSDGEPTGEMWCLACGESYPEGNDHNCRIDEQTRAAEKRDLQDFHHKTSGEFGDHEPD